MQLSSSGNESRCLTYRQLITSCLPTDIRLFDFYRKRGLGPDQSHYNQSRLWSRLHTTIAQITRISPKWIYTEYIVLKLFSRFRIFEQLALALKNRICPENFHCIEYTFYIQDIWATCACPEKQSCPKIFHCIEIFFIIQFFWATCACPENRIGPDIFQTGGLPPFPPRTVPLWLQDATFTTRISWGLLRSNIIVTSVSLQMALLLIFATKFSVAFSRKHYFLYTGISYSARILKIRFILKVFANLRLPRHHISTGEKLNKTD